MRKKRYCPNCVTDMRKGRRGKELIFKCPNCGVVEKADQPQESSIIKINRNEENKGTEGYYDCSEDNVIYHYIQQKDPS